MEATRYDKAFLARNAYVTVSLCLMSPVQSVAILFMQSLVMWQKGGVNIAQKSANIRVKVQVVLYRVQFAARRRIKISLTKKDPKAEIFFVPEDVRLFGETNSTVVKSMRTGPMANQFIGIS